jgi:hypothetical protein
VRIGLEKLLCDWNREGGGDGGGLTRIGSYDGCELEE